MVSIRTRRIVRRERCAPGAASWVVVEAVDNGRGFCEEGLARGTQSSFTRNKCGGTGIGLATVRRIVEDRGGGLALENGRGGGAIVRFRLPESTP